MIPSSANSRAESDVFASRFCGITLPGALSLIPCSANSQAGSVAGGIIICIFVPCMLNLGPIRQLGLPVLEIADAVNRQLADAACLVVTAPPGAGKSTVLPLTILAGFVDGNGSGPKGSEMIPSELGDGGSLRGTPLNESGPKGSKIIPSELGDGGSLRGTPLNGSGQKGSKIIILEPRRIAARQIAERMAALLGEPVGRTVGYRIRFESRVSSATRIEVVTEGILTRMLVDDPALEGVSVVIFDEFHERSLASDVALALTREAQQLLRPDLRIVLMSATIDTEALCRALDAPLIESAGRMFPVEIRHTPEEASQENVAVRVAHWVRVALREHEGDVLAFLPGEAEIRRCAELLEGIGAAAGDSPVKTANDGTVRPTRDEKVKTANDERVRPTTDGRESERVTIFPLYGMLPPEQQRAAIAPSAPGARKVVLATPIAETSLTIEGVRVVVDGGFCRRMVFDPQNALSRLETVRISRDMADQRSGRAGRVAPGVCYRLWGRGTEARMAATRVPEILEADLAGTVLDAAAWGEPHPERLAWLTPPPAAHLAQASRLLELLGAVDADGRITRHGRDLAALPCHPRIAQLLLDADGPQERALAADIAALLEEKDPLAATTDDAALTMRLDALRAARRSSRGGRWSRILTIADQYASARGKTSPQRPGQDENPAARGKTSTQRPG
ncbi:MAG: helicase-related protein, partial [Eubacteriales bacterium]|nr:helicase-related protein [Eubacteriales bacterium]